jgi:murein L,D-transpeptidase YafK
MTVGFALAVLLVSPAADPCRGKGTTLYVNTARRAMWLCEAGVSTATMRVALGQGGVGKHFEGDAKVPLGEYSISQARSSQSFHLFLLVGYPTPQQRRAGFTGSAVGVHGPMRGFSGPSSTDQDWTLGCIAVGTDREIERVADWVKTKAVRRILIENR